MTFIRSFLIAGAVSALFGFGLKNVFGFWEATILAFVLQFVVAFIYSSIKISNNTTLSQEYQSELEQLLSFSEASVPCPCGNYIHTDNMFVNIDNTYTCEKCNNEFRIDVSLTPTLLTNPVDVNQESFADISNEEAFKEIPEGASITQDYTEGKQL
tara:strand:+ start:398 stop:865 length:468 start_codon:yes stop_codon:yes gene_type:complete